MRSLAVFLFAVLGCSLAEGRLVSKCELRDKLMKAIDGLPEMAKQKALSMDNLAKAVCHVELASGFNTSAVNELTPEMEEHHHRGKRHAFKGKAEREEPSSTVQPRTRERQYTKQAPSKTRQPTPPTRPPRLDEEVWTLYGLFQLSNHLVCSDGTTPSPNICATDCSNLVDDDIDDDISCLFKIFSDLIEDGFGAQHWEELRRMIRLIFQEECRSKQASEYFAECT